MKVRGDENGLNVTHYPEAGHALELIESCDLSMDDAGAGGPVGLGAPGFFAAVQHHVDGPIANGMDCNLQIVLRRQRDELIKFVLGVDGHSRVKGFIGIRVGQAAVRPPKEPSAKASEDRGSGVFPAGRSSRPQYVCSSSTVAMVDCSWIRMGSSPARANCP